MKTVKKMMYKRMGMPKDIERIQEAHEAEDAERLIRLFQIIPERSLKDLLAELQKADPVLSENIERLYLREKRAKEWFQWIKENEQIKLEKELANTYPYLTPAVFREILDASEGKWREKLGKYYRYVKKEKKLDILFIDWEKDESFVDAVENILFKD